MSSKGFVAQKISKGYSPDLLPSIAKRRLAKIQGPKRLSTESFEDFCQQLEIVDVYGARCRLNFNPIQALFHVDRTGRDVVLKPRQIGFTTLELARDLYKFACTEGARVVVVCQSVSDNAPAKLLSGVLQQMIASLKKAGWNPCFTTEAWNEWVLPNGNSLRIIVAGASEAAAQKKGRAGTITRLHVTEMAFYEHPDETLNALLECVPGPETGSEIVIESTANGAAGMFFDYCKKAESGALSDYTFHFYAWYQHPSYKRELDPGESLEPYSDKEKALLDRGVTPEQIKWRRNKIAEKGASHCSQEYPDDSESCFLVSGRGYFDSEALSRLGEFTSDPIETREQGRVRIYRRPDPNRTYLLTLDPSEGVGDDDPEKKTHDPAGGVLFEAETGEQVAIIDGQFRPPDLANLAVKLATEYGQALIACERNNHGHAVHTALAKALDGDPYPNVYLFYKDGRPGWNTNLETRPKMLNDLEASVRDGSFRTPDARLLSQLRTFVIRDGKPQASTGAKDDLVLAAAIGWAVRQRMSFGRDLSVGGARSKR
jgi:hypothetical protein